MTLFYQRHRHLAAIRRVLILGAMVSPLAGRLIGVVGTEPAPTSDVTVHRRAKPLPAGAVTSDWPGFLGPTRDGICIETKLLKNWALEGPALVWEMNRGEGYAAPSIAGQRLVFFHRLGDQATVDCLHAETGTPFWRYQYQSDYRDRYGFSNGPRASPVIDDDRCYVHGVEGRLLCLDMRTGKVLWQRDTSKDFKVPQDFFGVGSTPLVDGNRLIVIVGAPGGPTVVALDKKSGDIIWKSGEKWTAGYASPVMAVVDGRRTLFAFTGGDSQPPRGGLLALDPSTGGVIFEYPFRGKKYETINAACPVVAGKLIFLTAQNAGAAVLRVTGKGGVDERWRTAEYEAHFATPILREGHVYGISGIQGCEIALECIDLAGQKVVWRQVPQWEETIRRGNGEEKMPFGIGLGSMIAMDEGFLILSEDGVLIRADLSPKGFKEISRARLFRAAETFTGPVVSRGLLYVCQNRPDTELKKGPRLLCYDLRAGLAAQ
jgi:outer membrane protein assembly factor BamB